MKITNCTHWRSDHLRTFLTTVALEELDSKDRRRLTVEVGYNRGGKRYHYVSGRAWRLGTHIKIMVPSGTVDRVDLALVIAHEMAHLRGIHHRQMIGSSRYRRVGTWREFYAWAEELPLEKQAQKSAPSREQRKEGKYQHILKMSQTWQRKVRIAQGRLKTWQRRLRRLETWRETQSAQAAEHPNRQETDHVA